MLLPNHKTIHRSKVIHPDYSNRGIKDDIYVYSVLRLYRVTGNCAQMGENAGYYIAEAIKTQREILDVKPEFKLTYRDL